ncbi:MAG: right-handed parallel beta-helix repeat-containing protein, partial [Candidatus Paceibacterota bacterium]
QGIIPKNDVTLYGYGTKLKLPFTTTPNKPIITYNSDTMLVNFNMYGINFADENTTKTLDLVQITQPSWDAPTKTWYMSVVKDCFFNGGVNGLYCPVPGSVKIDSCFFDNCDVGLKWEEEHFYINNSVFWDCRIGIDSNVGNHFSCINGVFAHCDEYGVKWNGFESAFIGCSFIDNKLGGIYGSFENARIQGNRILQCAKGIFVDGQYNLITDNQIANGVSARDIVDSTDVTGIHVTGNALFNLISDNTVVDFYDGIVVNGRNNTISGNDIARCAENGVENNSNTNSSIGNKIHKAGVGILNKASIQDALINDNSITSCDREGIIFDGSVTGLNLNNNQIVDNGLIVANTHSGVLFKAQIIAGIINANLIRNSGIREMKYGIEMESNPYSSDVLINGNVTRNLKSTYGYVLTA